MTNAPEIALPPPVPMLTKGERARLARRRRTDPLESAIEKAVAKYATQNGILNYKFSSPAKRSVPDRLLLTRYGKCFFVEFKRLGGKPTVSQLTEHKRIKDRGYPVYVIDTIDEGKRLVDLYA